MREEIRDIAAHCRHYAMCKIDYLGTGLCPSGPEKHYVAYYPQGRMDLYDALVQERVPVTAGAVDIAATCTLCGICDRQCHFVVEMRPRRVMQALKAHVAAHVAAGKPVVVPEEDDMLRGLRAIVGRDAATNDPAILVTYANDPFPLQGPKMPRYVVLPQTTEDVAAIIRFAQAHDLAYAVRGSGGSVYGMVFSDGIVLDTIRMKEIAVDPENWTATVGAGVTAFELQQAAYRHGMRANAAEPAATVCGNVICTGIFSPWSATYGWAADNVVDMEFVDGEGHVFYLGDAAAPNLFAYRHASVAAPGICTRAMVRLHPRTDDETAMLVPFEDFAGAVHFARELNRRRIGIAIAVLGPHYMANFISPTAALAAQLKTGLSDTLSIAYAVFVVADAYDRDAIRRMATSVIDAELIRTLILGVPHLLDEDWADMVQTFAGDRLPYDMLTEPEIAPLLDAVLQPAPETLAGAVDEDLRDFYTALYRRPEFGDLAWLNAHRVISPRMGRDKHIFAFLVFVPLSDIDLIAEINAEFARLGDAHGLDHAYGFLTPVDLGKLGVLEYDYYLDQTDVEDRQRAGALLADVVPWLDALALNVTGVTWIKTFFLQGTARKESILYRGLRERSAGMETAL